MELPVQRLVPSMHALQAGMHITGMHAVSISIHSSAAASNSDPNWSCRRPFVLMSNSEALF